MNSTISILVAATVLLGGFGVASVYMADYDLSPASREQERLEDVPFQVRVHSSLSQSAYILSEKDDNALRSYLASRPVKLKQCVLKVLPARQGEDVFGSRVGPDRVNISLTVKLADGRSFSTRNRLVESRSIGAQALKHLLAAWERYDALSAAGNADPHSSKNVLGL